MDIQNIQKTKERKSIALALRSYPSYCKWMKDNNISPTALFNEAVKELMKKKTGAKKSK